ncbi:MAG: ribonuclease HII [Eubacteriales bacterium]|nr:ribonuclease HII [Eubacteriales bacterium]
MMKKTAEIKAEFEQADYTAWAELIREYETDERATVKNLLARYQRKIAAEQKEDARLEKMLLFERKYPEAELICGIDEAGRGPLAGPVVAGAVILPKECKIRYLNDSKQLSEKKREALYDEIREKAVAVGVGIVSWERIDEINILQATYEAMRTAIADLGVTPDLLLNDAVKIPEVSIRQIPIIHGDASSLSIAAASVIAKVTRDRLMKEYDELMQEYGFAKHKGYGCASHIEAIREHGPSVIHRRSFLKNILEENE